MTAKNILLSEEVNEEEIDEEPLKLLSFQDLERDFQAQLN